MLETPGQLLSASIYYMFLNIYKSIPLSDPIIFVLARGLLTSKVKEYVPNMSF